MRVTFSRTGDRRYRVSIERETAPALVMQPAPGFDPYLPHDLVHFLVERHWRLREGIYGDLAAGGDAGTFRPIEVTRDRRRARKRAGLATSGRDMGRSERLAAAVFAAWSQHAGRVPATSAHARAAAADAGLTADDLAAIIPACDEAAERWHSLRVGDAMSYEWQQPAHRPTSSQGRRARIR